MKLWYDRNSKDPTYFIQKGYRNGKKTTTKNIARIGKHSELFKITDDPLAYAKEQVAKYNEEEKYDGYYAVATNLDDPAQEIIRIRSQRYKIEDCFRVRKAPSDHRAGQYQTPRPPIPSGRFPI